MLWRLFQLSLAFLVFGSNIIWRWTDNPMVVSISAGFAALIGTLWLSNAIRLLRSRERTALLARREQRRYERSKRQIAP